MKSLFEHLTPGVYPGSVEYVFQPSEIAEKYLFYPTWVGHYLCSSKYYFDQIYDSFYIFYIQKGSLFIDYRGEIYTAEAGDTLILNKEGPRFYKAYEGLDFYYFGFRGSNSEELVQHILDTRGFHIKSPNNTMVRNYMEDAIQIYEKFDAENQMSGSRRIYNMLTYLMQETDNGKETPSDLVVRSIYYIRENFQKPISLELLARQAKLSPAYYSTLFKQETGLSPREYIMDTRLSNAKLLLAQTGKSIAEIAEMVGYTNAVSLTNMFRDKVGCSPLQFRKLTKQQKNPSK